MKEQKEFFASENDVRVKAKSCGLSGHKPSGGQAVRPGDKPSVWGTSRPSGGQAVRPGDKPSVRGTSRPLTDTHISGSCAA